jgi:OmcA/MtrC family decaheme c-type cytochrome
MTTFNHFLRLSWAFLVAVTLTLGLAGCEGDDGAAGSTGAAGQPGADGSDGTACWDLNANGIGDLPGEDINGDGVVDALDCGAGADPVAAAIENANIESCATCHDGIGDGHQALYDAYVDASTLTLTLNSVASVAGANAGEFDVTLDFSIAENGAPYVDAAGLPGLDQKRFYMVQYDSVTGQYLQGNQRLRENNVLPGAAAGDYILTQTGMPFAPELSDAHVYGYIADGGLFSVDHGPGSEIPEGSHVHLYDNVANAALAFGTAAVTDAAAYESLANVSGCENCHGQPYLKHGFRAAEVAGLPDFAACKSCHYDDRNGGHEEWQYMVDDPINWATAGLPEAEVEATYAYKASVMNDTHMSHAMEFPYPQSASNCSTCHAGKLVEVLDDSNFTAETCKSCHAIQGIDAWPKTYDAAGDEILSGGGNSIPGKYYQGNRAPAFDYLWQKDADLTFHDSVIASTAPDACTFCHGAAGIAGGLSTYHTGYDPTIYDDTGTKYADLNTVSIDQITRSGDTLTVNFSSNNTDIVPELYVSFYGWDSKHFLVGSHERDSNSACSGFRPGCKMEYVPESSGGGTNPLFTEDPASAPGAWMVTLDMAALQLTKTDVLPTLIANGDITKAEVTIAPELEIGGIDVVLKAVDETFDLNAGVLVADYFKGGASTVEITKCNACHDALASSFHDGSGRAGDGIEVCKNCHTTTFGGSHIEMASRAIDSYTHAIHSFQDFDVGDTFEEFDPVIAKRYDQHTHHVFPNFTIRNCEACHRDGTYNVPDQSESMPGLLSASDTVATWYNIAAGLAVEDAAGRSIGMVPEAVTGPASRACGGCHRARLIRDDAAGDLLSLNAHTESFGTYEENDDDDAILFGIIDKIMSMFE